MEQPYRIIGTFEGTKSSWSDDRPMEGETAAMIQQLLDMGVVIEAILPYGESRIVLDDEDYEWNMEQARINGWLYKKVKSPESQESVLIEYVDLRGVNCTYIRPSPPLDPEAIWRETMSFMGGFCGEK